MLMLWQDEFHSDHQAQAVTVPRYRLLQSQMCTVPLARELWSLTIPTVKRRCCNGKTAVLKVLRSDSSMLVYFVAAGPLSNQEMIIFLIVLIRTLYSLKLPKICWQGRMEFTETPRLPSLILKKGMILHIYLIALSSLQ